MGGVEPVRLSGPPNGHGRSCAHGCHSNADDIQRVHDADSCGCDAPGERMTHARACALARARTPARPPLYPPTNTCLRVLPEPRVPRVYLCRKGSIATAHAARVGCSISHQVLEAPESEGNPTRERPVWNAVRKETGIDWVRAAPLHSVCLWTCKQMHNCRIRWKRGP